MRDNYTLASDPVSGPADRAVVAVPSDTAVLVDTSKALYVGGAGNIRVKLNESTDAVTFFSVPAGCFLPLRVDRIYATGTTATNIIILN